MECVEKKPRDDQVVGFVVFLLLFVCLVLIIGYTIARIESRNKEAAIRAEFRRDAVRIGHATYVTDENGEAVWMWLPPCNPEMKDGE